MNSRFSFFFQLVALATLSASTVLAQSSLAQTPPMGWNSWNYFADKVDDKGIRAAADQIVASGMKDAGYIYVNIDDGWQGERDANGVIRPNAKFPDMKALADYVHSKGLKIGIYSSPGTRTCGGYAGSYGHEEQDAKIYAEWGIDYLKYDLCSFYSEVPEKELRHRHAAQMALLIAVPASLVILVIVLALWIANGRLSQAVLVLCKVGVVFLVPVLVLGFSPNARSRAGRAFDHVKSQLVSLIPESKGNQNVQNGAGQRDRIVAAYAKMGNALEATGHPIVYSLSEYGLDSVWEWAPKLGGNLWRTTNDITPEWDRIYAIASQQTGLEGYSGPGRWNDPDMLEVGNGRLSFAENRAHFSWWAMLAAPLLAGNDLPNMKPEIKAILTNKDVIAIDQDSLGKQGQRAYSQGEVEVWTRQLQGGAWAIAVINVGSDRYSANPFRLDLGKLQLNSWRKGDSLRGKDLWSGKDITLTDQMPIQLSSHDVLLVRVDHLE
jgi:hypothetical protein